MIKPISRRVHLTRSLETKKTAPRLSVASISRAENRITAPAEKAISAVAGALSEGGCPRI